MNILTADVLTPARSTAELDRLGDEIAELSAHSKPPPRVFWISSASSTRARAGAMASPLAPTG